MNTQQQLYCNSKQVPTGVPAALQPLVRFRQKLQGQCQAVHSSHVPVSQPLLAHRHVALMSVRTCT